ncbi:MAG: hypothetical protein LBB24_01440 [Rickettsiales bacterium]|jgi:hypothetical protein|nr:hypothetical protein [Rickettsiales bacterium]
MKIIDNLGDFIEKIEAAKKTNKLDVSGDEDLSIAIMNLISIEEHLFFSGAKTHDSHFYDMIEEIRECRKELLGKIIKTYRGEVWCISKHLLASSMRLSEVGTKLLHSGNRTEAYDFFEKAYDLYCLFWGLNLDVTDEGTTRELVEKVDKGTAENLDRSLNGVPEEITSSGTEHDTDQTGESPNGKKSRKGFGTILKDFITKTINCCRE